MASKRVLLLDSVDDVGTLLRHQQIIRSVQLAGYDVEHTSLIELSEQEFERGEVRRDHLDTSELLNRLSTVINAFQPSIILVHAGFAFRHYTRDVLHVLRDIKRDHPMIRMGLERKEQFLQALQYSWRSTSDQIYEPELLDLLFEDNAEISMLLAEMMP